MRTALVLLLFAVSAAAQTGTTPPPGNAPSSVVRNQRLFGFCTWPGNGDFLSVAAGARQGYLALSKDGVAWDIFDSGASIINPLTNSYNSYNWFRDNGCAIWYPTDAPTGVWIGAGDWGGSTPLMVTSSDLQNFSGFYHPDPFGNANVGSCNNSPSVFVDPADNSIHILFQSGPGNTGCVSQSSPSIYEYHPNVQTLAGLAGTWSTPVQLNANGTTFIDPAMIKVGSTYHLIAKENSSDVIEGATSTTLTGPYTFPSTPTDMFGLGTGSEKPSILMIDATTCRIWVDHEFGQAPYKFSDSTDGCNTFGAPTNIIEPNGEFGYGQGVNNDNSGGSYYIRAGQTWVTNDQNWINIMLQAYQTHHIASRGLNAPNSPVRARVFETGTNAVTASATPQFNLSLGDPTITLTGNVTSSTIFGAAAGMKPTFYICQGATAYTFAWPSNFHGTLTIGTTTNKCSVFQFGSPDGINFFLQSSSLNQ